MHTLRPLSQPLSQVLTEGLPLLEELNGVPARKPTASSVVYGAAAKAGLPLPLFLPLPLLLPVPVPVPLPLPLPLPVPVPLPKAGGDVRSRIEQEYRPLLKVQVAACTVR